jgi:hypothetical protein
VRRRIRRADSHRLVDLRMRIGSDVRRDPRDDFVRCRRQPEDAENGDGAVHVNGVPSRFGHRLGKDDARFLPDLARDVAGDVAAPVDDVFRLYSAARLIRRAKVAVAL